MLNVALVEVCLYQDAPFYLSLRDPSAHRGSLCFSFISQSFSISLNLELVPPCRIAIRNVTSLAMGLLYRCTSGAFLRVGSIGIRLPPIRCRYFAIGQYDGVALLRFFFPTGYVATSPLKTL